jgi:hypothetical protein
MINTQRQWQNLFYNFVDPSTERCFAFYVKIGRTFARIGRIFSCTGRKIISGPGNSAHDVFLQSILILQCNLQRTLQCKCRYSKKATLLHDVTQQSTCNTMWNCYVRYSDTQNGMDNQHRYRRTLCNNGQEV